MNVLPVYFPSLSIGPPKSPPARRVAGLTGWLILILFYLVFTICQKAQTSLSSFLPVRKSWPFQVCVFWGDCQCDVARQDSLQGIWDRGQEASILDRVSLPQCSEDIGFVWSLLGVLCKGHGLVNTLGLLFILASGLAASLVCTMPGSKMLSGPSLDLETVDCGWTFTLCQWKASRLPQAFGFAFPPREHFFLWKTPTENFRTWEMDRIAGAFPAACS